MTMESFEAIQSPTVVDTLGLTCQAQFLLFFAILIHPTLTRSVIILVFDKFCSSCTQSMSPCHIIYFVFFPEYNQEIYSHSSWGFTYSCRVYNVWCHFPRYLPQGRNLPHIHVLWEFRISDLRSDTLCLLRVHGWFTSREVFVHSEFWSDEWRVELLVWHVGLGLQSTWRNIVRHYKNVDLVQIMQNFDNVVIQRCKMWVLGWHARPFLNPSPLKRFKHDMRDKNLRR